MRDKSQWIKTVHFKLGNEMWKVNWSTRHERGTKKTPGSPIGIKPMNSQRQGGYLVSKAGIVSDMLLF